MEDLAELFDRAVAAEDAGRLGDAIELYDTIVAQDERHPDAVYNRGVVHFRRGQLEVAARDFGRATELDPSAAYAFSNLGVCLRDLGQRAGTLIVEGQDGSRLVTGDGVGLLRRALAAFDRSIELEPDPRRLMNRAVLRRTLGDHDGAVQDARASAALGDRKAPVFLKNEYGLDA